MISRPFAPLRSLGVLLLLVAGFLVAPQVVSPARACADSHADFVLTGFDGVPQSPPFYMSAEDQSPATVTIEGLIHDCGGSQPAIVDWMTTNGTASGGSDYVHSDGPSNNLNDNCGGDCPAGLDVPVTIINDSLPEDIAEYLRITISTPDGRVQGPPTVPIFIVDNEGSSRAAFAPASTLQYQGQEYATTPRIPVFRAGNASGSMTVNFSLAGSGADPAEANDFGPSSGTITFNASERLKYVAFTVTNDTLVENAETITATLTGAGVGSPSTATYTIIDEDQDNTAPVTRFHHPRQGLIYRYNDYRIREMHTYFSDSGGSGVVKAWLALRKQRLNGQCSWYTGSGFASAPCGAKRWLPMKPLADLYLRAVDPLTPSIGTKVKNYRAWTRAQDGAGNMETSFTAGRNLSTFEVKRP
jgi:hypothetical protein